MGVRWLGALALAVAVLGTGPEARADQVTRPVPVADDLIGLLDVRVEGVSDAAAEVFAKQIEESLGIAGLQVAPRARLREFLAGTPWNAACLIGDCLKELKTHAGVAKVVEAALVSIGPSYHYTLTVLDTETGVILKQTSRKCDVCTTDEAFADAALAIVELISALNEGHSGAARKPGPDPRAKGRRATRRAALALVGAAVVAGAGGAYLMSRDEDRLGAAAVGAAGAFAVAGVTCLGVSFSF